jgi:hypothetical protein
MINTRLCKLLAIKHLQGAEQMIQATIEVREEDPEMKERLKMIVTSAGNPSRWTDIIKPSGVKWLRRGEKSGVARPTQYSI